MYWRSDVLEKVNVVSDFILVRLSIPVAVTRLHPVKSEHIKLVLRSVGRLASFTADIKGGDVRQLRQNEKVLISEGTIWDIVIVSI